MKVCIALIVFAAALAGCAGIAPGVQFAAGERVACAQTQKCLVFTPEQMRRFYGLAFQAGRAYEEGRVKGEQSQHEDATPWLDDDFFQRSM